MADASCSGTTPFKRLVDHQGRDFSHHQDRLVSRSPAQHHGSFRSAPQPSQGDGGFEAFMNGAPGLQGMPHPHGSAARLSAHAAALRTEPTLGFVSTPAPYHSNTGVQTSAPPMGDMGQWAADFTRFTSQRQNLPQPAQAGIPPASSSMQLNSPPSQYRFQSAFTPQNMAFSGMPAHGFADTTASTNQRPDFDMELSKWMSSHGNGAGMEQVDAAMEQMARELDLNDAAVAESEKAALQEETDRLEAFYDPPQAIGPETPEGRRHARAYLEEQEEQLRLMVKEHEKITEEQRARSAVGDAAEKLLESVENEQSEKWKNSTFLSLMRDFRDGRKDVVDNEIRQTNDDDDAFG